MALDPEARYSLQLTSLITKLMSAAGLYSTSRGYMLQSQYDTDVKQSSIFVYELLKAFQAYHTKKDSGSLLAADPSASIRRFIIDSAADLPKNARDFLDDVVTEGIGMFHDR